MAVHVEAYSPAWPQQFEKIAVQLRSVLGRVPSATIEHVGSTSVPGLAAKPVLDIDIVVPGEDIADAVEALESVGYAHRGDLGVTGREAFDAPDDNPRRNVYVCRAGSLSVRNHLAVRDVLRTRPDLRDEYGAMKRRLAADPSMDIETYVAKKSAVLQKVLALSDFTDDERREIRRLNDPSA